MSTPEATSSTAEVDAPQILAGLETDLHGLDAHGRRQAAVLAFGRRANARPPLPVLMQDAVALVTEILQADLGGVGEVVADGMTLTLKVPTTEEDDGRGKPVIHKSSLSPEESMAGFALTTASTVVSENLASEKRFTDLFLRKLRILSGMTIPLHLNKEPFGVLGIYTRKQREFTRDDVQFVETIALLLSASIARLKAEEAAQKEHSFTSKVVETVHALVIVLDSQARLVRINRACQRITGFSIEEIREKPFCSVFVTPKDLELFQGVFRSTINDRSPCEFESDLLTKAGSRRKVFWSLQVMCDDQQVVQSILLTGDDRTEQLEAQEELQRAKIVADEANRTLRELREEIAAGDPPRYRPPSDSDQAAAKKPPGRETDASRPFFQSAGGKERRSSPRRGFRYRQAIAPIYAGAMPSPGKFFEVVCEDLSAGGIAFYMEEPPDFEDLVVALGRAPAVNHFTARVVRVLDRQFEGRTMQLVGCRFTGRVYL